MQVENYYEDKGAGSSCEGAHLFELLVLIPPSPSLTIKTLEVSIVRLMSSSIRCLVLSMVNVFELVKQGIQTCLQCGILVFFTR